MPFENEPPRARPTGMVRALVVVAQDQPDLWQSLTRHFATNEDVEVLIDRRHGERRQRLQTYAFDRRGPERRRPTSIENDVRTRHYVITRSRH